MKKKKRYLIIISTVLFIMLISGIGLIIAGGPGRFCGDGFHPGFHHRDIRKHILARMDSRAQQLDLREDQKEKYREIRKKVEADLDRIKEKRRGLLRTIEAEINRENPDMKAITNLVKTRLKEMPDLVGSHLDHFEEFYNILDKEQKARVIKKFRDKFENFRS